jgi:hypothetical protein
MERFFLKTRGIVSLTPSNFFVVVALKLEKLQRFQFFGVFFPKLGLYWTGACTRLDGVFTRGLNQAKILKKIKNIGNYMIISCRKFGNYKWKNDKVFL